MSADAMDEAFADIPEPEGVEPPLQALAACNERLLRHCTSLRRLGLYLAECGADALAQQEIARLFRFFDLVLPRQHQDQERDLLPALIESMAGSDAVCLREMRDGLAQQHRQLRAQWLHLRTMLDEIAGGRSTTLLVHEVEAFIASCRECVAREDGELLPMASRLLTDEQLRDIAGSMQKRRGRT